MKDNDPGPIIMGGITLVGSNDFQTLCLFIGGLLKPSANRVSDILLNHIKAHNAICVKTKANSLNATWPRFLIQMNSELIVLSSSIYISSDWMKPPEQRRAAVHCEMALLHDLIV